MASPTERRRAALQALVAVVIWGASFASTKRLLAELSPESVLFARSVLASVLIGGNLALRGALRPLPRTEWPLLFGLATLGLVVTQALQAYALLHSTSANTAWLVGLNPVVTAGLAAWLLGERLGGKLPGLGLAFVGALLVVSHGLSPVAALARPSTRADLLTLVSTVSWALYTIYGRNLAARHDPRLITAHVVILAAAVFAPGFVARGGWRELAALSGEGWGCLLYLGLGCSGLAFALFSSALEHLEASQIAVFIYLEPLIAQALGVATLGEPLSFAVLAGGAAILTGVYLVSTANGREPVALRTAGALPPSSRRD